MTRNLLSILTALTIMAAMASGCSSGRNAATTATGPGVAVPADLADRTLPQLYASFTGSFSGWTDVKAPVSLSLEAPRRMSVSATMTMVRDRGLSVSVRILGMEMASVTVTGDSVFAMSKPHRCYLAESISELLAGFPATTGNLQDLLLGRPFVIGGATMTPALEHGYELGADAGVWGIKPAAAPGGVEYAFVMDSRSAPTVSLLQASWGRTATATVTYSDPADTPSGPAASGVALATTLSRDNKAVKASVEWNFRKAKWNSGATVEWRRPQGYTRVTPAELVKLLNSL